LYSLIPIVVTILVTSDLFLAPMFNKSELSLYFQMQLNLFLPFLHVYIAEELSS
jgi:hypothetical protein